MSKPTPREIDQDPDLDDDGNLDVEQYPLPTGLQKAAQEADVDLDAI